MHPSEADPARLQWRRSLNEGQVRSLAAEYRMGDKSEACEDANEEYNLRYRDLDEHNITPIKERKKRSSSRYR